MVKFISYVCFWVVFSVGSITTLYGLGSLGVKAYRKIKELFTKKIDK